MIVDFTTGSNRPNITPLTGAVNQLQINRRHTLASNPSLINNALKSNLTVQISPLQAKRRYTLSTAAILNSARKAVDQAHKVAEQQKRRSISSMGSPHENSAVTDAPEQRTPLKPTNSRAFYRENEERAASTPEGEWFVFWQRFWTRHLTNEFLYLFTYKPSIALSQDTKLERPDDECKLV